MLTAICRYGPRVLPETGAIVRRCRERGELIKGPAIRQFEQAFAAKLGVDDAVSASYGRVAFYYLLEALELPKGGEVILPALTFWVVPEMVRVAGLTPVFADVDPQTFNLDPAAFERAITDRTVAVVPTHLYGLPCQMDKIMAIADRRGLRVIEDCAHALGARFKGRLTGAFGDAAFFSFQTLKPLNTYGGGIAVTRDRLVLDRVRAQADAEPWPAEERTNNRLELGAAQRIFSSPGVFTLTAYPALLAASLYRARPDVYLWEKIRPLSPMPDGYRERYTNVQAARGSWTRRCPACRASEFPTFPTVRSTCTTSTASMRRTATRWSGAPFGGAWTSRRCMLTSVRLCRSSASIRVRPMPRRQRTSSSCRCTRPSASATRRESQKKYGGSSPQISGRSPSPPRRPVPTAPRAPDPFSRTPPNQRRAC